jgi:hypothetical protein
MGHLLPIAFFFEISAPVRAGPYWYHTITLCFWELGSALWRIFPQLKWLER